VNWWRSRRPQEQVPEPEAVGGPETETAAPTRDPILLLQHAVGNRAVQKIVPRSPGAPIPEGERLQLENAFGQDLSEVRLHHDQDAVAMAAEAGATAFTSGRDIYFSPGAYGSATLAHEVGHVVQQALAPSVLSGEDAFLEHQANAASSAFLSGQTAPVSAPVPAPALQRQPLPGTQSSPLKLLPSQSLALDGFDIDKFDLSGSHKQKLDEFAKHLKETLASAPDSIVTIVGFADAPGSEPHNLALGQQRADTVRAYLVSKGISAGQLHTASLGEGVPTVPSKGYEARNRRVEIDVIERSFFRASVAQPPPAPAQAAPPVTPKPVDLTFHPKEPTPSEEFQERWRQVDQAVREAKEAEKANQGASVADASGRILRRAAKKMGLPDWAQDRAESLARDLPSKGAQSVFDQITGDRNLDNNTRNALKALIDALMRMKVK